MNKQEMTATIAEGDGFIAALDQSGGSTPKALRAYGVSDDEWDGEDEMYGKIHEMRCRIITAPSFSGKKVVGAILFEKTMDGMVDGKPVPAALIEKGVVPFIKIDKGLEDEADGVQLMKPMPELDALLTRASGLGVFGTKERSVINKASASGIAAIVAQQFEVGKQVIGHGMMPILEPEYSIKAEDRAEGEKILRDEILKNLDALPDGQQVMLKLSIPVVPNTYKALVDHPKVLKVVALSGGYSRDEACAELAKNEGMIASFSRALLEELRAQMSDEEFDATLGEAIDAIHAASTKKVAA
ncbi:fructose-bisphosphate aldolase class I [Altererythrobacter atlanticus]|uniref:fructose-bisphosphate aldolase n=1 Tax=Croceibacterium atlanticum TaxID=1267766 RepID=A0A0F7KQJ6_9SPHN|nr:fructose bisphosphate aldolase [Croceibacterium atlanticum]AKH41422.1 Fructose-bisphosphate aldolase class 1 [Croceibacterium atlanticum]MBB5732884.1 fructose-bisphosphate aldolase class I [Croceibacterium atlanticum]